MGEGGAVGAGSRGAEVAEHTASSAGEENIAARRQAGEVDTSAVEDGVIRASCCAAVAAGR